MARRVLQLTVLALISDVVVILVELVAGMDPLADFQQRPILYLYMFLGTILAFGVFGYLLGSREALLEEQSITDHLTGLYNSRYFHERLRQATATAQRHGSPLSLALFDVDHFKRINDEHGHPAGDQVLQSIGEVFRTYLREGEIAARVGGEEFGLLLPDMPVTVATDAAERIRKAVSRETADRNAEIGAVTFSAGVASVDTDDEDCNALYSRADQALYQSKQDGRDRVSVARTGSSRTSTLPHPHPRRRDRVCG